MRAKPYYTARFHDALCARMSAASLTVQDVAKLIPDASLKTVYKWRNGTSAPGMRRLRIACRCIGIDAESVLDRDASLDVKIASSFLSFEMLDARYLSTVDRDIVLACTYVSVAAAMLHNYLCVSGYPSILTVNASMSCVVRLADAQLKAFSFLVDGSPGVGITFRLRDGDINISDPQKITKAFLDKIVRKGLAHVK